MLDRLANGKVDGKDACHSLGCYRYFLDESERKKEHDRVKAAAIEKEKKEKTEHEKAQAEFNRKKALERSDRQMQEWFNKKKREMREQRRAQEELNQREKEERKREYARQQEEYREQQERAERERNRFPPPSINPDSDQRRPSQPSEDVWAGVSAGMRYQAEKLKSEFDTWNRNFPNQKKEYPLWIQRFFGRGI